jgi:hypothetical protein
MYYMSFICTVYYFLYASSSFIHNHFLFINVILHFVVFGQLNVIVNIKENGACQWKWLCYR